MPKQTFYNLSEEKRKTLENVAIDEFAENGFDKASINTIVEKSGISKGSFYQYFNDKKDLFLYIILEITVEKKMEYITPTMMNPMEHDFFTLMREMFYSGMKFAKENRKLSAIGTWMMNNTQHPVFKEIMDSTGNISTNTYTDLIKLAISRGEIRSDIDIEFTSSLVQNLLLHSMEYYYLQNDVTNLADEDDGILEVINKFIEIIKNGIKAQ